MVHLRSVCLRGFKSFAKPTQLTFEPGVTVIIGPNGSGKSNIADAVLWVLGEQSPGNLRGKSMQDVIFSGPGGRKSSAVAEVSLVFDNGDGTLPLAYEQLEVTRRLTRDSGSEYRLNGSSCRLLDVQDLFGGLGLGREMHSVISQGKVESLLNSTPEARRALIEEAAGLGRFKKRRERALVKLERTRQNLLRVGDVEREVKSALRPLRQQVAAAEKLAEATEEWALAKGRQILHELVEVSESWAETGREIAVAETRLRETAEAIAGLRRERAAEEERFAAALREREELSALFHQARALAEQMEGRAATLRQRLARSEGELDRSKRRLALARTEAAATRERLAVATAGTADNVRLTRVAAWSESLRAALEESLPSYRAALAAEEELKETVFEYETARTRRLQDRDFLKRQIDERDRVRAELTLMAEEAEGRLRQLQEEALRLESLKEQSRLALEKAQSDLRQAAGDREEARDALDEAGRAEAAVGERLAGIEARQAVLGDVLARREGLPPGARELLDSGQECRPLTDVLKVKPGYERAVAAALGDLARAVVVESASQLFRAFEVAGPLEAVRSAEPDEALPVQGAVVSALGQRMPGGASELVDLWEVVSGPETVLHTLRCLLPPTAVATEGGTSDLAALCSALEKGGEEDGADEDGTWQIVTRTGELVRGGVHVARRQDVAAETVLRSRNELEAAALEHRALLDESEAAAAAVKRAASLLADIEARYQQCEERVHQAQRDLTAQVGDCELHAGRVEQARLQVAELQRRREQEGKAADQYRAQLEEVEAALKAHESELEQARNRLRSLQTELATTREKVARLEEKKSQAALVEVRLRERCRSQESERARMLAQREAADREASRCERRVRALEACLPLLTKLLSSAEALAEKGRSAVTALEQKLGATRLQTESATVTLRDREFAEAALQTETQQITGRLTELRVAQALLEDRKSGLEAEIAELCRRHSSPRGLGAEDIAGEDAESLAAAVERAERRRERIGPVNPLAEQECAEMEQRAQFLAEQRRDLEASMNQLQDVIRELDAHIETTFAEIFESARRNFSDVIASVFPGARGSLRLTEAKAGRRAARAAGTGGNGAGGDRAGGDGAGGSGVSGGRADGSRDGGDGAAGDRAGGDGAVQAELVAGVLGAEEDESSQPAGIEIEVRFPNKSPRSLTLLSGGEKAMTAIAFLFSLFLARPCPFYILDEVEASLDEINIRRFLNLVRKYRERTQFIIITHQRQTMEVADTLYGVTLESDGTSRVLSRRLTTAKGA